MKKTRLLILAFFLFTKLLFAQNQYLGEIRIFAGSYAPLDWAFCDGTILPINGYPELYAIIGSKYGGDGVTTFALPDLRSRVPVGAGQGIGLTNRVLGQKNGQETVTLTTANMPAHNHTAGLIVSNANATASVPTAASSIATSGSFSGRAFVPNLSYNSSPPEILLQTVTSSSAGNSIPVSIIAPRLGINYIISLYGTYPQE